MEDRYRSGPLTWWVRENNAVERIRTSGLRRLPMSSFVRQTRNAISVDNFKDCSILYILEAMNCLRLRNCF
jgi:hypothetical protein